MLELRPLSPALGVEAVGLDLDARAHRARRAVDVARRVFRKPIWCSCAAIASTMATQRDFASLFGPVIDSAYVSNARPDGIIPHGALLFHSDLAFTPASLPRAVVARARATAVRVVDLLRRRRRCLPSAAVVAARSRRMVCTATHAFDLQTQRGDGRAYREPVPARGRPGTPSGVARTSASSATAVLYVNEMQTERINELAPDESDDLIERAVRAPVLGRVHLRASAGNWAI